MALRLGLGLGLSGGVSFSPLSLFAASEPGFWFDPSDISTLFQDAAGTTPVTAAGQSVGLVLDKSKGLVLGAELANATLLDKRGGTDGTVTRTGDIISFTAAASGLSTAISQEITGLVIGRCYRMTAQARKIAGSGVIFQVRDASGGGGNALASSSSDITTSTFQTRTLYWIATATSAFFSFNAQAGGVIEIDGSSYSVRELSGNHATQSTSLSRPTYQVDSNGRGHLLFDGSDDFLVTPTITPGTDKVQVFAGVRKLSDAVVGVVIESSANAVVNNGTFTLRAPRSAAANYVFASRGTALAEAYPPSNYAAPITNVVSAISDISGDGAVLRVNNTQAASSTTDQGTGNYLAYPVYIGRLGGASAPFNGRIYSLICRFGPNLTADQIAQTEAWVNARTGAY